MRRALILLILMILVSVLALTLGSNPKTPTGAVVQEVISEVPESAPMPEQKENVILPEQPETMENEIIPVKNETVEEPEPEKKEENVAYIGFYNLHFVPTEITVEKNTAVTWVHNDSYRPSAGHKIIIYTDPPIVSGILTYQDSFTHTFSEPGEYTFSDQIFSQKRGKIIVK